MNTEIWNTETLAARIYVRVITDRMLGAPKTWTVDPKQAAKIARAALDAAEIFLAESAKAQSIEPLTQTAVGSAEVFAKTPKPTK